MTNIFTKAALATAIFAQQPPAPDLIPIPDSTLPLKVEAPSGQAKPAPAPIEDLFTAPAPTIELPPPLSGPDIFSPVEKKEAKTSEEIKTKITIDTPIQESAKSIQKSLKKFANHMNLEYRIADNPNNDFKRTLLEISGNFERLSGASEGTIDGDPTALISRAKVNLEGMERGAGIKAAPIADVGKIPTYSNGEPIDDKHKMAILAHDLQYFVDETIRRDAIQPKFQVPIQRY